MGRRGEGGDVGRREAGEVGVREKPDRRGTARPGQAVPGEGRERRREREIEREESEKRRERERGSGWRLGHALDVLLVHQGVGDIQGPFPDGDVVVLGRRSVAQSKALHQVRHTRDRLQLEVCTTRCPYVVDALHGMQHRVQEYMALRSLVGPALSSCTYKNSSRDPFVSRPQGVPSAETN